MITDKLTAVGFTGSGRTVRRAVAAVKTNCRAGRRRVYRPWIPEPGMWAQWDPAERRSVLRHAVQCFCLTSQSLSSDEMARRFLDNLAAIAQACADDVGPFIYAVHSNRIERLRLDDA